MIKGFVTKDSTADPLAFDPNAWAPRLQQLASQIQATSIDLSKFAAKGGKLLIAHGTIDDSITPYNTINYWNRLTQANSAVTDFARFYLVPGFGHGEGLFYANHDWLSTVRAWVEGGTAPVNLVASDGNTDAATATTNGRTRPPVRIRHLPAIHRARQPHPAAGQRHGQLHLLHELSPSATREPAATAPSTSTP